MTGIKGRVRDEEAQEDAPTPQKAKQWRRPSFRQEAKGGTVYGNAVHSVMQFIRYEACTDMNGVSAELDRLTAAGYLREEQREMVQPQTIALFFDTEVGRKLRGGVPYIREFKFSILDDGEKYGDGLAGEQVLLQGVVDCALLEEDGITVLDFKTDHVSEETLFDTVSRYQTQVDAYADALTRIFEKPVKGKYLYFFHLNRLVAV